MHKSRKTTDRVVKGHEICKNVPNNLSISEATNSSFTYSICQINCHFKVPTIVGITSKDLATVPSS